MIKCFLSHSSNDKDSYVRLVSNKLRKETTIIDENTFEAGMSPIEEIISALDETTLFVIFLSDSALKSDWVKFELDRAKNLLNESKIGRIFPILIDPHVTFDDSRIPAWMKEDLNLQHISQPKIAARKINARLRELAWSIHPKLKERERIFVGRNDKINELEERLDDITKQTPIVIIASGLPAIGRKSFLRNGLKKANVIRESFEFPILSLSENDSIEDFILKADDLGLAKVTSSFNPLTTTIEEKIDIVVNLTTQLVSERERILIEDNGAIIQYDGTLVDWFMDVINQSSIQDYIVYCIASKYRVNKLLSIRNPSFFVTEIPELEKPERNGLLKRYSDFVGLQLKTEDLSFFSDTLTGYPEQVIFAVDLIKDFSVFEAKKKSHLIQEYSADKAKVVLKGLKDKPDELDFLYLLSKFEFISYELIFSIVDEEKYYLILNGFISSSICERLGANGDYIRVNEVIRDYISRNRFGIPEKFKVALENHVNDFVSNYQDDNRDISDYMFSIQQALINGERINEKLLVPSYFLKTIKSLYEEERNYIEATKLADRILTRSEFIHSKIIEHIRFIKCQCLARLRDNNFFEEVQKIKEPEKSFLHGFFYRLGGEQKKAIESYLRVLQVNQNDQRTKSELTLIYMQYEEYDLAFDLAKENYDRYSNNPINANNYFACLLHKLLHKERTPDNRRELQEIIDKLKSNPSDRAQEMSSSAEAKLVGLYDRNKDLAFDIIEDTINQHKSVTYPILTKADLAIKFKDASKLEEAINLLDDLCIRKNAQTYRTYIRYKAIYISMTSGKDKAIAFAKKELHGLRKSTMLKLLEKIESFNN